MLGGRKKPRKYEYIIRLAWFDDCTYKVVYFHRVDANELFDILARLTCKRLDYSLKVRKEEVEDVE